MKKKFFIKYTMINIVAIMISFSIIIVVISYGYYDYIHNKKEKLFYEVEEWIVKGVKNGYDQKDLRNMYQKGYHVFVFNNEKLIFSNDNMIIYGDYDFQKEAHEKKFSTQFYKINSQALRSKREVAVDDEKYTVYISHPLNIPGKNLLLIELAQFISLIAVVGLIISIITSYLYGEYIRKQLRSLSIMLEKMEFFNLKITNTVTSKRELGILEGQIIKLYNSLYDTTKELEKEVTKVKKLEKDRYDFIRGVTHELKTPIMSIKILLVEMLKSEKIHFESEENLMKIDDKLSDMNSLITEVISMYRYENSNNIGSSNIEYSITEVLKIYEVLLNDKELEVKFSIQDHFQKIDIPPNNFMKILSNLLSNASKYAPKKSVITIQVNENEISIKNLNYASIPYDSVELIKPFKSFNRNEDISSHGLGLYVVDVILTKYEYKYSLETKQNIFEIKIKLENNG